MWELDGKESWAPKNWCFWTFVLEKTLESPLDCKEINRILLLPSIFSSIRVFSSESALPIRWPKYQRFSISPSNEYSGLISYRIDCFDLLAVQRTLKSRLLHHNLKASILQHSAFFMVQCSQPYTTTGKTIALTIYVPLLTKRCLCFLICYLGLSF